MCPISNDPRALSEPATCILLAGDEARNPLSEALNRFPGQDVDFIVKHDHAGIPRQVIGVQTRRCYSLSASHTSGGYMVALGNGRIGCDIEDTTRFPRAIPRWAEAIATENRIDRIVCWTLIEAVLKSLEMTLLNFKCLARDKQLSLRLAPRAVNVSIEDKAHDFYRFHPKIGPLLACIVSPHPQLTLITNTGMMFCTADNQAPKQMRPTVVVE